MSAVEMRVITRVGATVRLSYTTNGKRRGVLRATSEIPDAGPNTCPPPTRIDLASLPARERWLEQFGDLRTDVRPVLDALVEDVLAQEDTGTTAASEVKPDARLQGHNVSYEIVEPTSEPVDGAALLDKLVADAERFIAAPAGVFVAVAIWVLHTYTIEACEISPRLVISSPCPGCGKTRVLDWLETVVRSPDRCEHTTVAAMFRIIELHQPTLLVNEADTFFQKNDHLRGVVDSGYARNGTVRLTVGDNHEPRAFRTFAAQAIAGIGELPRTIVERAIPIEMEKKTREERRERLRPRTLMLENLAFRRQLARWAIDNVDSLREVEPHFPNGLTDRQCDVWEPLFVITDRVGGSWPAKARTAASVLCGISSAKTEGIGEQLLSDLRDLYEQQHEDVLATETILNHLNQLEERPWPTWHRGNPLDARALARLLKAYQVSSKSLRVPGPDRKDVKGYRLNDLRVAFDRYLPDRSSHTAPQNSNVSVPPSQSFDHNGLADVSSVQRKNASTAPNSLQRNECDAATDGNGEDGRDAQIGSLDGDPPAPRDRRPWSHSHSCPCSECSEPRR